MSVLRAFLAGSCACLALAASGCGSDAGSGPAVGGLRPQADPKDQLEFGHNAVRVGGIAPADVAAGALLAAYPKGEEPPTSWFLVRRDRWIDAVLAAQFATSPINAALAPIEKDYLPTATVDALDRLEVNGYPKAKGLEAIVMGKAGVDVFVGLKDRKLKTTLVKEKTPFTLAERLVPFHGGGLGRYSPTIVVASGEERDYALPAAAWSAYSGDPLALVTRDEIPAPTRRLIAQRQKLTLERPHIYVIGPDDVISDDVVTQLAAYGPVKRVAGDSASETAVALARFRDPKTQFGWGFDRAPANVSLVNTDDWANAIGAFTFAATGPQAPLLLTDSSEKVPDEVIEYLRDIAGSEASQGFVFGDRQSIGSKAFRQFDKALGTR